MEIPWWTYGARGMQLWFPKTLAEPLLASAASHTHCATDPELEFDREVYPIGVSLSEVSIVGAASSDPSLRVLKRGDNACKRLMLLLMRDSF